MRMPTPARALLACLALTFAASAPADDRDSAPQEAAEPVATGSGPLRVETRVELLELERGPDGQPVGRFVAAGRLEAGDEVHYTIRVENPGRVAVHDVVVTKLMPFGVGYMEGSAVGPDCETQFSVDGGRTFAPARGLRVEAFGKPVRKAEPADYTHLRWVLRRPLAPGAVAILRFRATFS